MSVESSMTFDSLVSRERLFDGEELVGVFKNTNAGNEATNQPIPPQVQCIKTVKRPSAMEFEGASGEFLLGKDLVDVFASQPDNENSMGTSYHSYRRRSTLSRASNDKRDSFMSIMSFGNDRRESLMSLADMSLIENPSQIEATQDLRDIKIEPTPIMPLSRESKAVEDKSDKNKNNADVSDNNKSSDSNNVDANKDKDEEIEYIRNIGPYDIICGRNNGAHNWVGNRRFRITIMMNLKRYTEAPTREEKTHVIKSVIELLLDTEEVGARFIKKVGEGMYVRLKDKQIREKVGHAFRDMISLAEQEGGKLEAKCFQ